MSAPNNPAIVVGAGFSGATIARILAEQGVAVTLYETRSHVAGNCHTERDPQTDILVHRYGPHIFHTDDQDVWQFLTRFGEMHPYRHKVSAKVGDQIYSLPVNLKTINKFFGQSFTPDQAQAFITARCDTSINNPQNFEQKALSTIGPELYEAFFKSYTQKQWGCAPRDLPASVLARLPVRFTDNDAYFNHRYQGVPKQGYTALVTAMLDHPLITLHLNKAYTSADNTADNHVFWSGPLDGYFGYQLGRLGYRTLDFEDFTSDGDHLGCAVLNHCDADVPFTRITEHKHFAPWENHAQTLYTREISRSCKEGDTPYYPIRLVNEKKMLAQYVDLADRTKGVTFVGRLATYRYLDMDICISEAMQAARTYLETRRENAEMPAFCAPPL